MVFPIKIIGQHILLPVVTPNNIECSTNYAPVFDDEFTEGSLNMTLWEYGLNWTMATQDNYFGNPAMVQFTGSSVILTNAYSPIYYNSNWYDWQSGTISTPTTFSGAGGKVEIRCKFPSVEGTHPAFWLFGACRKEIDVFEVFGYTQKYQTNLHATAPTDPCQGPPVESWEENIIDVVPGQWYICSIEWNNIYVCWKINGNVVRTAYKYYYDNDATHPITGCAPANTLVYEDLLLPLNGDDLRLVLGNADDVVLSSSTSLEISYCKTYSLVPESPCTDTYLTISDGDIDNSDPNNYKVVSDAITTSGTTWVQPGTNVFWSAANSIQLQPGFSVPNSASFDAIIQPCYDADDALGPKRNNPDSKSNTYISNSANIINNKKDSLSQVSTGQNIRIAPNPSNGKVTIQFLDEPAGLNQDIVNSSESSIIVYDIVGRIVYQTSTSQKQIAINLSSEPSGIYVLMVKNNTQTYICKVIIQK